MSASLLPVRFLKTHLTVVVKMGVKHIHITSIASDAETARQITVRVSLFRANINSNTPNTIIIIREITKIVIAPQPIADFTVALLDNNRIFIKLLDGATKEKNAAYVVRTKAGIAARSASEARLTNTLPFVKNPKSKINLNAEKIKNASVMKIVTY